MHIRVEDKSRLKILKKTYSSLIKAFKLAYSILISLKRQKLYSNSISEYKKNAPRTGTPFTCLVWLGG